MHAHYVIIYCCDCILIDMIIYLQGLNLSRPLCVLLQILALIFQHKWLFKKKKRKEKNLRRGRIWTGRENGGMRNKIIFGSDMLAQLLDSGISLKNGT